MEEMNDLKKIAPNLSKIKKENPFRVPENYFDDFSARLQMRLEAEKRDLPEKENKFIRFLKPAIGLAASFALIFMLVYWPLKTFLPQQEAANETVATEISDNEYLSMIESLDENSFYALLDEPQTSQDLSDEELMNYLGDNVSDYEIYLGTDY